MDIQISSNFERLLFDLLARDGAKVAEKLGEFRETGRFALEGVARDQIDALFDGAVPNGHAGRLPAFVVESADQQG